MNQRQAIREALVAALSGETAAEARVMNQVDVDLEEGELPAISVHSGAEPVESLSEDRDQKRTLTVTVKIFTKSTEDSKSGQDAADAIACKVEGILEGNKLGGLLDDLTLTGTETDVDTKGHVFGSAILTYEAVYYT